MEHEAKQNAQARLSRVAGQVAGIQRMVDADRYCVDVLLQISAARAALAKTAQVLLESHIRHCVTGAFGTADPGGREEKIEELIRVFQKHHSS